MSDDIVELRGVDDPDEATLQDIWIAGHPLGKLFERRQQRIAELESQIQELEDSMNGDSEGIDLDARSRMIDIHVVLQDLEHGRTDHAKADIRAARFLQQFIQELAGTDALTGIEASHGRLKLDSDDARRILTEHNLDTDSGMTVTVGRAMDALVRGSEWGDQDRPLFTHASDSGHTLSVEIEAFREYLGSIQDALDADLDVTPRATDDPTTGEDPADVMDELDQLDVETAGNTNTVVSNESEGVLGGGSDD